MGTLLYLTKHSRPDITNPVQESDGASMPHVTEMYRVINFVLETKTLGLRMVPSFKDGIWKLEALSDTPSVLYLAHEFARNYFFPCERPILSKPIRLDSIGEDVHFDVYLQCSQKQSWVS